MRKRHHARFSQLSHNSYHALSRRKKKPWGGPRKATPERLYEVGWGGGIASASNDVATPRAHAEGFFEVGRQCLKAISGNLAKGYRNLLSPAFTPMAALVFARGCSILSLALGIGGHSHRIHRHLAPWIAPYPIIAGRTAWVPLRLMVDSGRQKLPSLIVLVAIPDFRNCDVSTAPFAWTTGQWPHQLDAEPKALFFGTAHLSGRAFA